MREVRFVDAGGESLEVTIADIPTPAPSSREIVLRVERCALNHRDLRRLDDGVETGRLPYVPGSDIAGVVETTGDGVTDLAPGDRVVACPNRTCGVCEFCREGPETRCEGYRIASGGLAEYVAVPADRVVRLPDEVSTAAAATLPIAYVTARRMLERAGLRPSNRAFIPGATGGVGVALVQLASRCGIGTVGTTTSPTKAARLRDIGADQVIESGEPDSIRAAIGDIRFDAALDHLGGEFASLALELVDRGGTLVSCGRTVDRFTEVDLMDVFWNHKRLLGSTMGTQGDLSALVEMVARNDLTPVVDDTVPLGSTTDAFDSLRQRNSFGKLLVAVDE